MLNSKDITILVSCEAMRGFFYLTSPNILHKFNTFLNIDKFDKFDKFDKTINRVEAQFVIIQKSMFIDD